MFVEVQRIPGDGNVAAAGGGASRRGKVGDRIARHLVLPRHDRLALGHVLVVGDRWGEHQRHDHPDSCSSRRHDGQTTDRDVDIDVVDIVDASTIVDIEIVTCR